MIIMIPIKCNGCGQELKDTRGFRSHCIKHHEGQDPGYTRIGQEVKQDEPQTDTHKHEDQKETSDSISQDEGPREDPRRDNKTKSPNDDGTNNDEKDDPVSTVRIITGSDKQDRAWMDDIIKQIATPENISLAVAAGVALLSGIVDKHTGNKPTQAGAGLTDLYGNVHEF